MTQELDKSLDTDLTWAKKPDATTARWIAQTSKPTPNRAKDSPDPKSQSPLFKPGDAISVMNLEDSTGPLWKPISWLNPAASLSLPNQLLTRLWNAQVSQRKNPELREFGGWIIHNTQESRLWFTSIYKGLRCDLVCRFPDSPERALDKEHKIYGLNEQTEFLRKNPVLLIYHSHAVERTSSCFSDADIQHFLLGTRLVYVIVTPIDFYLLVKTDSTISSSPKDKIGRFISTSRDTQTKIHEKCRECLAPLVRKHKFHVYWTQWPLDAVNLLKEKARISAKLVL